MKDARVDLEWVSLMLEAKKTGLSIHEIKEFINKEKYKRAMS
ncbi:anti-repressor SinI family protein [Bacillus sp. FJAT-52991]|uniref:Anti-repressor SinI family protein n=1 Tax=Bacillus kandeliae TaxID=3129297 RepID=A0ABZ2N5M6_9BACI